MWFGFVMYGLALVVTFLLIGALPVALLSLILEHRHHQRNRVPILVGISIGAGYLGGGIVGWALRPAQWVFSFAQTVEAAFNVTKYGHTVEWQAERVLMYPWYIATLGAIAAAVVAAVTLRRHPRSMGRGATV